MFCRFAKIELVLRTNQVCVIRALTQIAHAVDAADIVQQRVRYEQHKTQRHSACVQKEKEKVRAAEYHAGCLSFKSDTALPVARRYILTPMNMQSSICISGFRTVELAC